MAYIKSDGTIGYDDIFNVSVVQTQAEIDAIVNAQKISRDTETARLSTRASAITKLKALGFTDNELKALNIIN